MDLETAIATALEMILKAEGGYVNDPADPGGATNMGVTLKTYQSIHPDATVDDLKAMTVDEAKSIYREHYITIPHIDQLPPDIIPNVADMAVNAGVARAGKTLQTALDHVGQDVVADGQIGSGTIAAAAAAVEASGAGAVNNAIADVRVAFYKGLVAAKPALGKFLHGWLLRADSFRA